MNRRQSLTISAVLLVILGVIMIYLGLSSAAKILWPPVITGTGFFIIARGFMSSRSKIL
jgi:hypothetical protein